MIIFKGREVFKHMLALRTKYNPVSELELTYMGVLTQHNYDEQPYYTIRKASCGCAVLANICTISTRQIPSTMKNKSNNNISLGSITLLLLKMHEMLRLTYCIVNLVPCHFIQYDFTI